MTDTQLRFTLLIAIFAFSSRAIADDDADVVVISGTVSASDRQEEPTLEGVVIVARDEDNNDFLGASEETEANGEYTFTIPADRAESFLLYFVAPDGYATQFDRLLKGDATQQINKVLKPGPGESYGAAQAESGSSSPVQKPVQKPEGDKDEDGEASKQEMSLNRAMKEALDKLLVFEAIHTRLLLAGGELDQYDKMLKENVEAYVRGMATPKLGGRDRYNDELYRILESKYDAVARLYGVAEVAPPPSRRHHRRILPLFRRRR